MTNIQFLDSSDVLELHQTIMSMSSGSSGVLNQGNLSAGIDRAKNKNAYGETDLYVLATAYVFGIGKAHGFVDGNKRTAWMSCVVFLEGHGISVSTTLEAVERVVDLIKDQINETNFAAWLESISH